MHNNNQQNINIKIDEKQDVVPCKQCGNELFDLKVKLLVPQSPVLGQKQFIPMQVYCCSQCKEIMLNQNLIPVRDIKVKNN